MRSRALKNSDPLPNMNKILVIRVDGIGDLLNSTPAIALLRKNYPSAEITVLARPLTAPVLIGNPDVNRTLIFDRDGKHRGIRARLQFYRELRREGFQLAVAMQTAMWTHLVAFLSGATYRLGRYQKRFRSTLTHAWRGKYPKGETHEVDRNLELVRLICEGAGKRQLIFHLSPDEIAAAEARLTSLGIGTEAFLIGIHPGGSSFDKRWPEKRYAALADRLSQQYNATILLLRGPEEAALVQNIQAAMQSDSITYAPETIRDLGAMLSCCDLVVCNDSGPMHLAAALDVPTVAIFGPTDHVAWHPLSENASIVRRDMPCWPCSAHKCKIGWECTKKLPVEPVWDATTLTVEARQK
ncbi:lipopolysaccharide heptosyltransferase II [Candidatus Poribacteria bacterium]|nr:lipopolysaccharide heptosyltransferase II [Candidatus Poribacteria bacterium]MYA99525.1 lipopolysaccharide heptosyltransferase II [Candidatus Poribacteria bacterium]